MASHAPDAAHGASQAGGSRRPSRRPSHRLVLASASPARLGLLRSAGLAPEVRPSGVAEDEVTGLAAVDAVRVLAERKAAAVAERLGGETAGSEDPRLILACDSMLSIGDEVRGKPVSSDQARAWWRAQRGRAGVLATGHALVDLATGRRSSAVAETVVRFGCPTDAEIDAYIATGEPLEVAGACTIDRYGAPFVAGIEGDHGTVIGLSVPLLRGLLADLGIAITDLWVRPARPAPRPAS